MAFRYCSGCEAALDKPSIEQDLGGEPNDCHRCGKEQDAGSCLEEIVLEMYLENKKLKAVVIELARREKLRDAAESPSAS